MTTRQKPRARAGGPPAMSIKARLQAMRDTCAVDPARLRAASHAFDALSHRDQMALAQELVIARGEEFCRLYPNVVKVSFGHRRKVDRTRRRHRVIARPCVRFLVVGKWNERGRRRRTTRSRPDHLRIPERLLAFATVGGARTLCAIPTDVEDVAPYLRVRGQGARITVFWDGNSESGALACSIRRDVVRDRLYAVSAFHVLSLSAWPIGESTWGTPVHVGEGGIVGPTRAIAGDLETDDAFDAQLLEVTDRGALATALGSAPPGGSAEDISQLPLKYTIVTPRGRVPATFVDFGTYGYDVGVGHVWHPNLVQSQPVEPTMPGDSGSPVVSSDGSLLLGMHVAGLATRDAQGNALAIAYMIPAWELLKPGNYHNVASSEEWEIP